MNGHGTAPCMGITAKCLLYFAVPKVQFKEALYSVNEKDGQLAALIYRSGDVNHKSTVRCYTRQGSAQVMMDYEERPNTDDSVVVFLPGKIFFKGSFPSKQIIAFSEKDFC